MKYKIEVHSIGYDDTVKVIDRPSLNRVTKTDVLEAKLEWCEHNDIDLDGNFEMPFTRISRCGSRTCGTCDGSGRNTLGELCEVCGGSGFVVAT